MPRQAAFEILIGFEKRGTYANLALKNKLRDIPSAQDRSFVTSLVYGTIERKLTLDYYISKASSVKLKKISPVNITILRMGLYQILFMNVPESAACNTSVELAKKNGSRKSTGFINAVLRRLAETHKSIELPDDPTKRISVEYSVDTGVYKTIADSIGADEAKKLLNTRDTDIYAAVNTLKISEDELIEKLKAEGADPERTDLEGLIRFSGRSVEGLEAFNDGLMHIIGKPSYVAAMLFAPAEGQTAIDVCAAPGGKSFVAAYRSNDKASILAFELHNQRVQGIMSNALRLGVKSVRAAQADGTVLNNELIDIADTVLCDVPCSGFGVIPQKPDIKYKSADFDSLVSTQYAILKNSAEYLKSGGRLVYSTCTVNNAENGGVIRKFLSANKQFEIDKTAHIYDNVYGEKLFLPGNGINEGFYIAVLKKR